MVSTAQVFDASALVPLLTNCPGQRAVLDAAIGVEILVPHLHIGKVRHQDLHADAAIGVEILVPHLADVEVLHALRGLWLAGQIEEAELVIAAADLEAMPMPRFGMTGLHHRVLQLRQNLSVYDATYVALAEALELELVTYDRAMAAAPGIRCDVILLEG